MTRGPPADRSSRHRPPACAVTMTTAAPCARSAVACARIVSASGATDRPPTFEAIVAVNAPRVITPMIPTLTPAASNEDRRLHVGPLDRAAARGVDEIRREERERRLRRPGLQRPSWIVGGRARGRRRPDRAEVELMVARPRRRRSRARCTPRPPTHLPSHSTRASPETCRRRRSAGRRRRHARGPSRRFFR